MRPFRARNPNRAAIARELPILVAGRSGHLEASSDVWDDRVRRAEAQIARRRVVQRRAAADGLHAGSVLEDRYRQRRVELELLRDAVREQEGARDLVVDRRTIYGSRAARNAQDDGARLIAPDQSEADISPRDHLGAADRDQPARPGVGPKRLRIHAAARLGRITVSCKRRLGHAQQQNDRPRSADHGADPIIFPVSDIERLFTDRGGFYHVFFIDVLRYGAGLRAMLRRGGWLKNGAKVLDAGCGTGVLTRGLVDIAREQGLHGITHHAFDLTQAMLDRFDRWAKANAAHVEMRRANVLRLADLAPDWRNYDLIVTSAMLEYLDPAELPGALRSLSDLLAPNGTLVVGLTRKNLLMRWLIGAWWKGNLYTRAEAERAFEDAGLDAHFVHFPSVYRYLDLWGHVVHAEKRGTAKR